MNPELKGNNEESFASLGRGYNDAPMEDSASLRLRAADSVFFYRLPPPCFFRRLDPGKVARGCQRLAGDEAAAAEAAAGAASHQDTHYTTITKRDKGGGREARDGDLGLTFAAR